MTLSPPGSLSPGARPRVLLVEDDAQLGPLLVELLVDDYSVDLARDGQSGLHRGLTGAFDLLVLDRGLPAIDGLDLLGRLRRAGIAAPALFLTARGTVRDKVEGLDAGAEDYLVKPFDIDELLARLRALLRRHTDQGAVVEIGESRLDVAARRITRAAGPGQVASDITLTARECQLLEVLARRPHQVFSRADLLDLVFDSEDSPNSVDTYVHYLRRKLGRGVVSTVRGLGYRLGGS